MFYFSECHQLAASFMHVFCKEQSQGREGLLTITEKKDFLLQIRPNSRDVPCDKCRRRLYRNEEQFSKTTDVTAKPAFDDCVHPAPKPRKFTTSSPPSVKLSLSSTAKSHSYFFMQKIWP